MTDLPLIIEKIENIYTWIEKQLKKDNTSCLSCGKCCNFKSFDHRLYVTTPELIYFKEKLGLEKIPTMTNGQCPYCVDNKCSVRKCRFAGCRIFFCKGDIDLQSEITEKAMQKFHDICRKFDITYEYMELSAALKSLQKKLI